MTLDIRPLLDPDELNAIIPQKRQAAAMLTGEQHDNAAILKAGPAFICYDQDGPLGAVGLCIKWRGAAAAWAVIAERALFNPVGGMMVTTMARRMLEAADYERIECHVEEGWQQAHRWVRALGFESEGLMRKFRDGRDYRLYAKVK